MRSGDYSGKKHCRPQAEQNAAARPRTTDKTNQEQEHQQQQEQEQKQEQEQLNVQEQAKDTSNYSVTLTLNTVPEYLHDSKLYQVFQEEHDSDQNFSVPAKYCKKDDSVHSQEDLVHLCHSLRYWGVTELPQTIISAALGENGVCLREVVKDFGSELSFLKDLSLIQDLPEAERLLGSISIGSLGLVKYLHGQQGCENFVDKFGNSHLRLIPDGSSYCSEAARLGQLPILMYLHENNFHWDTTITACAARGGHLNCLQYAHEQGCPWNERTTSYAASEGHLNCLQYAHEQGCPWNELTTRYAARNGHFNCLQYAYEHGCP